MVVPVYVQCLVTMVTSKWCLYVLISTLSLCSLGAGLLGCGTNEQILSLNAELLPTGGISVSSRLIDAYAPADVINFGVEEFDVWCGSRDDDDPYVLLRFSSTVVITGLVSGGYMSTVDPDMRYVTNFTIEYSLSSYADDFTFYSTNVTGSPKYLHVPTINTLFALEQPFLARRVRFSPKAWNTGGSSSYNYPCWSFLIYGCRSSEATDHEACPQPPPPSSHLPPHPLPLSSLPPHPSPLPSLPPLPPELSTCPPLPSSSPTASPVQVELIPRTQVVVRDYQVVVIAVPIVLVTILIMVVVVGVGIAVIVRGRGVSLNLDVRNPCSTADISMEKCRAYDTVTHTGSSVQKDTKPCNEEEDIYEN